MITINELQIENLKKVKAVKLEPSASGLTVIGGRNGQGKTSILDAIAWALGGEKFRPGNPARGGQNSSLKVIDSTGKKSGQRLLNEFISTLALDLPAFMHASEAEKSKALLQIIGVGDQLMEIIWNMGAPCADITAHRIADALHVLHGELTGGKPIPYVERYRNMRPVDAKALQRLLYANGMTHKDLALSCRASQASISAIFTGHAHPSANLLLKIAWALDVPPERIMQTKRPTGKSRKVKDSLPPK